VRLHGVVYVQEPLAEGPYFELVRSVEDETEVRAAAQRALEHPEAAGLRAVDALEYDAVVRHRDFASFRDAVLLADQRRAAAFDALVADVEERFERGAERTPEGRIFLQPTRVTLLRRPAV
jgi:hypothetical protein